MPINIHMQKLWEKPILIQNVMNTDNMFTFFKAFTIVAYNSPNWLFAVTQIAGY